MRAIFGISLIVERLAGLCHVELALVAAGIGTVEVVNAESVVARLLYLYQEVARADAVDTAGGNEEAVAGVRVVLGEVRSERAVGKALGIAIGRKVCIEAGAERCAGLRAYDIPHLGLTVRVSHALRHGIVGVHLDA